MGMPHVTHVPPTFDDAQSVNLRVFIDDDGGGGCTIQFWEWSELFKPPKFYCYASYPNKITGAVVQYHSAVIGFKWQQRYFVRAINGADVYDTYPENFWPIRDTKTLAGQPWLITAASSSFVARTMTFACTTDIPCHLFLAYADHEPYIKRRAHQKRGTVLWHDGEHGLIVKGYVEQAEAGDTLDHTLTLVYPPGVNHFWWFLFGDVDNRRSPSRSPFFDAECGFVPTTTVRCYPKRTGNDDNSLIGQYDWNYRFDGSTYYPKDTGYPAFLAGWPVVDPVGTLYHTSSCGSMGSANTVPDGRILSNATYSKVKWDFAPLPLGAVVVGSVLHCRLKSTYVTGGGAYYYPYGSHFKNAAILGAPVGVFTIQDVDAGNSWIGGSEPWIDFYNDITTNGALALSFPWPPPPALRRDINTTFYLGWGLRSLGDCAYLDVTYETP